MADNDGWQDDDEAAALAAFEAAALDATSTTSIAVPAVGATVSMAIGTGKQCPEGCHWVFAYKADIANNFTLETDSYSGGVLSGVCVVSNGSGTYADWTASHIGSSDPAFPSSSLAFLHGFLGGL